MVLAEARGTVGAEGSGEKVAVVVVAEDDTQCAVTGDFGDAADYIITASSKPFKSGDQVRFAQE